MSTRSGWLGSLKTVLSRAESSHRLKRLQDEWARVTVELGIRAEVIPAAVNDDLPTTGE